VPCQMVPGARWNGGSEGKGGDIGDSTPSEFATQHFGDAVRVTVGANVLPYWFKQLQGMKF